MSESRLRPSKIVCVGRNYTEHAEELGNIVPERPLIFFKPPSSIIADGEAIVLPNASQQVEHEGEIGLVIETPIKDANPWGVMSAVAGITCVNDVTARDLQKTDNQWARAKGFDTFCPVGPQVVPIKDLPALEELQVYCRVNGEERQHGYAKDMVFKIPDIICYISSIMTLEAGDIIATGTPAGVGLLVAGDMVEVEIPGVGVLRNEVVGR